MLATEALPRFACPDWWERIKAGQTPMADVPLNQEKAAKALAFFNRLKLPDVPGNPPLSEACGEWFREILCAFLASEDPETKQRLVWELLCMVPKKNSKTTYVAALGLTALFMEEAPNRQMLIVAPSQNISERCFDQAQGMIRLDPRLDAIFKVQDHLKCIERRKTGTQLNVKTFDTSIVTGEIPILTIIDEVHELGKKAKAAAVMQQITRRRHHHAGRPAADDHDPVGRAAGRHLENRTRQGAQDQGRQGRQRTDPAAGPLRIPAGAAARPGLLAQPAALEVPAAEHRPLDRPATSCRRL
jgi:phage terminase large subunit-like protein